VGRGVGRSVNGSRRARPLKKKGVGAALELLGVSDVSPRSDPTLSDRGGVGGWGFFVWCLGGFWGGGGCGRVYFCFVSSGVCRGVGGTR